MLGMFDRKVMPVYPDEAMQKEIQGNVIFKLEIDATGKVVLAAPVEGAPLLVAAAVEALQNSHFRPFLLNGTPLAVETQIGYLFSVSKTGDHVQGSVDCITSLPDRPEFRTGVVTDSGVLVLAPRKSSSVEPKLPPDLTGKRGSVYLVITVGTDGRVQDVQVVGGDEPFIGPVVDAVKQETYEPRLLNGQPVVAKIEASYHFGPR